MNAKTSSGGGYRENFGKLVFGSLVFCITMLCSAVFFSSIGFGSEVLNSASATDSDLSVNLAPVISLRVAKDYNDGNGYVDISELDLSVTPTPAGTFTKDDLSVLVSTSNETGYTLTLANNDTDTAMHYTDTNPPTPSITSTITSITSPAYESTFPDNSWAYSLEDITASDQVFDPIPTASASDIIKTTATSATNDATDVTFATKVDSSLVAGTYLDTIVFSATPNYVPPEQSEFTVAPISTTELNGGETFTLTSDIAWTDELGGMFVTLYPAHDVSDTASCTNPTAFPYTYDGTNGPSVASSSTSKMVVGQDYVNITCTSPARAAGVYHVKLELFKYNKEYIAGNTITYINPAYNVTITKGTGINQISGTNITATTASSATGINQYNTTVTLNATLATGYNTFTWTVTSGNATLSSTTGSSVSFTMPKEPVTVSVSAKANTYTVYFYGNQTGQSIYNTAQTVSGSTSSQSYTYGTSQALRANGFSRPGFRFLGWSTNSSATTATYTNQQSVSNLTSANNGSVSLYAIWQPQNQLTTITSMQQMTSAICNATYTPTSTATTTNTSQYFSSNNVPQRTLSDTRDSKTYNVAKLADGRCWMTQNLALGDAGTAITLTSADSDVTANFTIPANRIQASGTTDWTTSVNSIRVFNNGAKWVQPTSSGNTSTVNTTGTPPSQSQYIGNYYNWYTATASTGTASMTSGNATSSICPKGWGLPTGGANSDFTRLTGALVNITTNTDSVPTKSFTMQSSPNYFILSGRYESGVLNQGINVRWWSSTAVNGNNSHSLYFTAANVYPQNSSYKYNGFLVRCIAH